MTEGICSSMFSPSSSSLVVPSSPEDDSGQSINENISRPQSTDPCTSMCSRPLNAMAENPESNTRKKIEVLLYDEANLIENKNGFGQLSLFDLRIRLTS